MRSDCQAGNSDLFLSVRPLGAVGRYIADSECDFASTKITMRGSLWQTRQTV